MSKDLTLPDGSNEIFRNKIMRFAILSLAEGGGEGTEKEKEGEDRENEA